MHGLRVAVSRILTILALGLLALTTLATPQLAAAECPDIRMAVVGPMTGHLELMGEQMRRGAQLATDDINAKGGIGGCKIALTVHDDEADPTTAIAVAKKLAEDRVRFVIGHYNSGTSIPASRVYAKNNTLMVSPASTNPALTEFKLWNVVRTSGRDDVQGTFAAEYMADHFPDRNLAIVSDGTPYGDGLANKAGKALRAKKHREVLAAKIKQGQGDFGGLISKMKAAKIEVLFFAGLAEDFGQLIRQTKDAGLNVQFISGDGTLVDDLKVIAGPALEGVLFVFSLEDRSNPAAASVVGRFRSQGFEPEAYTLKSYAAVQVIAKGLEMAGVQAPRAVAASIKSGRPIPTVLGDLTFDTKGDRLKRDTAMYVWTKQSNGDFITEAAK
ncbi:branched-chain amino acid ABC transporter substrate-binding protein [Mesorhizobium sp. M8A.F.Ca.ET.208.01.1.1]|nr:branched-chain amino acid ABC transporter substrate-binding protein [Mesorhizobium sp. M8A.F.Ca.ET.023.02.2.1]RWC80445.1 MAG: branched-chain amino acid ABC transporter substrate-binding protein [Mesorhizobium sp.]TGQ85617.1 branched-chain amino acid ABC transporter substrate-binding protein [Mesorhizobium sp. M8A.F.Ca.ET.208.01.1.1]TGT47499.1 branched-chain amino acid ABC transporter substrate-binding protein [Mesorhizobium sp. M8A.F.Ca.ET.167.01.1.1]